MGKIRIELAINIQSSKPKIFKVLMINSNINFKQLKSAISAKVKIGKSKLRIFVSKNSSLPNGTEITEVTNLSEVLINGIVLVFSKGEDYKCKNSVSFLSKLDKNILSSLNKPPRHPFPGIKVDTKETEVDIKSNESNEISSKEQNTKESKNDSAKLNIPPLPKDNRSTISMDLFPIFEGNILDSLKKIARKYEGFNIYDLGEFTVFDYGLNTVFPKMTDCETAVLREYRGLIVSNITGKVVARRFHKFFNINQNGETKLSYIINKFNNNNYEIKEKIDGTLVSPILTQNDSIVWLTRKSYIDKVEIYVKTQPFLRYQKKLTELIIDMNKKGATLLFEWCDSDNLGHIIKFKKSRLVLLAIRDNANGHYYDLNSTYISDDRGDVSYYQFLNDSEIDYAKQLNYNSYQSLYDNIKDKMNDEGVVIYFDDGTLYKLKTDWYVNICYALKDGGKDNFLPSLLKKRDVKTLKNIPLEKIYYTSLKNQDDVISNIMSLIENQSEKDSFLNLVNQIQESLVKLEKEFVIWVTNSVKKTGNKEYPIHLLKLNGWSEDIVHFALKKKSFVDKIKLTLFSLIKSKKLDIFENILDIKWDMVSAKLEKDIHILDFSDFTLDSCSEKLIDHVLNSYLPKRVSNILGISQSLLGSSTVINIPRNYQPNEGKAKGYWEQFTNENIWDLRIDLQSSVKQLDGHNGDSDFALILVQYGLYNNKDTKPHGSLAGVFVPTETDVQYKDIYDGIKESFNLKKYIKLRRAQKLNGKNWKIFCDLDGVLVDFCKGVRNLTGYEPEQMSLKKMWTHILNRPKFFSELDWTENGQELWSYLIKLVGIENVTSSINILTGLPYSKKKKVEKDKIEWCRKKLNYDITVHTCNSSEKWKYSDQRMILIDDRIELKSQWEKYGGVFIHHTSTARTVSVLNKLYGIENKLSLNDLEDVSVDSDVFFSKSKRFVFISEFNEEFKYDEDTSNYITNSIQNSKFIGIDFEWDNNSTYKISTIQISTENDNFIFDMI